MNGVGTTFGPFIGNLFLPMGQSETQYITGGILFECGGFPLPFIVSGGLLVFCALAAAIVLDPSEELRQTREEGEEEEELDGNIGGDGKAKKGSLICSFPVVLGLLITILTGAANQWCVNIENFTSLKKTCTRYQPTLEPYVRKEFNMTSFQVLTNNTFIEIFSPECIFTQASMLFIIDGAVYAVASPLIGFLLDRCKRKWRWYDKSCPVY